MANPAILTAGVKLQIHTAGATKETLSQVAKSTGCHVESFDWTQDKLLETSPISRVHKVEILRLRAQNDIVFLAKWEI